MFLLELRKKKTINYCEIAKQKQCKRQTRQKNRWF